MEGFRRPGPETHRLLPYVCVGNGCVASGLNWAGAAFLGGRNVRSSACSSHLSWSPLETGSRLGSGLTHGHSVFLLLTCSLPLAGNADRNQCEKLSPTEVGSMTSKGHPPPKSSVITSSYGKRSPGWFLTILQATRSSGTGQQTGRTLPPLHTEPCS